MKNIIKVSLVACLFLCTSIGHGQDLRLDSLSKKAYDALWGLETPVQLGKSHAGITQIYVQSLHLALYTILREDKNELARYEGQYDELEVLIHKNEDSESHIFLRSEMLLHYAFVQLKYHNELSAGWAIRKSYKLAQKGNTDYPDYVPLIKTVAIHNIIMGSVPKKYDWIMSILGLEGNIDKGLTLLQDVYQIESPLSRECKALYNLIKAYVKNDYSQPHNPISIPESPLSNLVKGLIYLKTNSNELAIPQLEKLGIYQAKYPLLSYLMGESRLRSGELTKAKNNYNRFINTSMGLANIKDSYFKISLIYHLSENSDSTQYYMRLASKKGKEISEADQYAAKVIDHNRLPHPKILKIRLLTDGGYYNDAEKLITDLNQESFQDFADKLEFQYRSARLLHKQSKIEQAERFYLSVIEQSATKGNYLAPNSCLQLGYIYRGKKKYEKAEYYFKRVKEYSGHEYKNSIDQKAKTALQSLPESLLDVR